MFNVHVINVMVMLRCSLWLLWTSTRQDEACSELLVSSPFLTHICPVNSSILINWTRPSPILGASGILFHFYSISNRNYCWQTVRNYCWQTVKTLIRRRVLRRLIWVCTVCLCPKNRTLGLYGLILTVSCSPVAKASSSPSTCHSPCCAVSLN